MEHFLECPNYVWWTTTRMADQVLWHLFIFLNVDVLEFVQLMFIPHSKKKKKHFTRFLFWIRQFNNDIMYNYKGTTYKSIVEK